MSDSRKTGELIAIPNDYILSTSTDTQGIIVSASPDFCTISGLTREEMIGQPHSIVRHPDTPAQVFNDMWRTLSKGHPWQSLVKNRVQNGGYYWVMANASPIFENGKITGYISVRRAATEAQIEEGEFAYREIAAGRMKLQGGHLVPTRMSWRQRLSLFSHIRVSVANKFLMAFLPILLLGVILGALTLKQNLDAKNAYDLSNQQMALVSLASQLTHEAQKERGMSAGFLGSQGKNFATDLIGQRQAFDNRQRAFEQLVQQQPGLVTAELSALISDIRQQLEVVQKARPQIDQLSIASAQAIANYSRLAALLIQISSQMSRSAIDPEVAHMLYALQSMEQVKELAGIERAVLSNTFAANRFGDGFYERFVMLVGNQTSYANTFRDYAPPGLVSAFNTLENSTEFKQAQTYRDVVYRQNLRGGFNQSAPEWFAVQTAKIERLNDFIVQLNSEILQMTQQKATHKNRVFFVTFGFVFLAIFLSLYIGFEVFKSVVGTLRQINRVVGEIIESGQLSDRVRLQDTGDELTDVANAFDNMIGNMERSIFAVSEVMEQIAKGEFNHRVVDPLVGDMNTLKQGVNNAADSVEKTMQALNEVMAGLANGDFKVRMDERVPENLRQAVNATLATMDQAIEATQQVMTKLSHGEISQRIDLALKGSFKDLADSTNRSLDELQNAIGEINQVASALAQGDLTIQAKTQLGGELEELRQAVNSAVHSLANTLQGIQQATQQVGQASDEVNAGTQSLNERTQQQAASLEETASSMEQMTSSVQQSSANANEASRLALDVKHKAENGANVMQQTIAAMQGIRQASEKIGDIVGLIDSIAFQTNLLALNAAVEAARAGDHGRGFAVVAGEVRTLAQKSAEAANEIKHLISHTTEQITDGSKLVEASGEALNEINRGIESVTHLVEEMATAARDQSKGIQQVNIAITQIDSMTQQNAALVEETSANTETLQQNSQQMQQAVARFKLAKNLR
ncbi:MAG: methyl-accepting chemotaxis protein [Thiomicrospira sp.]